ncbi:hypothetical protein CY34DRAFT_811581 [Suillus luteus UH-Slu-Lm8-n1]|uniref:Uncharacterized protein n=1 Tax=Suillus luteus UH-Slu-Lm8-n1 TaxID=930992 RepID=A0A0D0AD82_9AGAM|nr:hypothetical protein CY34DRAFT_811581 [Suillus luteus UH-Slu-Lm8-n1]
MDLVIPWISLPHHSYLSVVLVQTPSIPSLVRWQDLGKQKARESQRNTASTVNIPLGQATYADVVGVDDGERPYVFFFCLSWFQKKKKKEVPQPPVYDDELEDNEEDEIVLDPIAVPPPGVQHEEIEMKIMTSQSQP